MLYLTPLGNDTTKSMEDSRQNSLEEIGFLRKEANQSDMKIQMVEVSNGLENKSIDKVLRKSNTYYANVKVHRSIEI